MTAACKANYFATPPILQAQTNLANEHSLIIKHLGQRPYLATWQQMQEFTATRHANTPDELWLVEHPCVFTQGLAGKPEHILNAGDIPIIQTDRGGQVTYHGPGQLVAYVLFDLHRLKIGIRHLVRTLEQTVIHVLAHYHITSQNRADAPGVYVNNAKICSIGLRVRRGCTYHGIALNVAMDLSPFSRINPCGLANLPMVQIRDYVNTIEILDVQQQVIHHIMKNFGYTAP